MIFKQIGLLSHGLWSLCRKMQPFVRSPTYIVRSVLLLLLSFFFAACDSTDPSGPGADGPLITEGIFQIQSDGEETTVRFEGDGSFRFTSVDFGLESCSVGIGSWQMSGDVLTITYSENNDPAVSEEYTVELSGNNLVLSDSEGSDRFSPVQDMRTCGSYGFFSGFVTIPGREGPLPPLMAVDSTLGAQARQGDMELTFRDPSEPNGELLTLRLFVNQPPITPGRYFIDSETYSAIDQQYVFEIQYRPDWTGEVYYEQDRIAGEGWLDIVELEEDKIAGSFFCPCFEYGLPGNTALNFDSEFRVEAD